MDILFGILQILILGFFSLCGPPHHVSTPKGTVQNSGRSGGGVDNTLHCIVLHSYSFTFRSAFMR